MTRCCKKFRNSRMLKRLATYIQNYKKHKYTMIKYSSCNYCNIAPRGSQIIWVQILRTMPNNSANPSKNISVDSGFSANSTTHIYIYRYVYSRPIPRLSRSCQVTLSKFHALNFKIASCLPFWTVLKKVHKFRQTQSGDAAGEQEDEENNQGDDRDGTTGDVQQQGQDTSIDNLLRQLKKLQRQRSTFDLVCSIFADNRVRQLGYMLLT